MTLCQQLEESDIDGFIEKTKTLLHYIETGEGDLSHVKLGNG